MWILFGTNCAVGWTLWTLHWTGWKKYLEEWHRTYCTYDDAPIVHNDLKTGCWVIYNTLGDWSPRMKASSTMTRQGPHLTWSQTSSSKCVGEPDYLGSTSPGCLWQTLVHISVTHIFTQHILPDVPSLNVEVDCVGLSVRHQIKDDKQHCSEASQTRITTQVWKAHDDSYSTIRREHNCKDKDDDKDTDKVPEIPYICYIWNQAYQTWW